MKAIGKRKAPINFEKHLPTILQHTHRFIDQHLTMSEPLYSTQQLRAHFDRENYDAVIVGSDQTWRPQYSPNIYNFFLDFLEDKNILRIAYASSFGVDDWEYTEEQTKRCAELAKKFDAISVREASGIILCRHYLGIEATHALDPTIILTKEAHEELIESKETGENSGIYTYILDKNTSKQEIINAASTELNEPVFSAQAKQSIELGMKGDASDYIMPSVVDWIAGFANAKFVITDSFHGMVFSIIFRKPFLVLNNTDRGAARFTSLLGLLNLTDRIITVGRNENFENKLKQPVDYNEINKILYALRKTSVNLLKNSLQ